MFKKSIGLGAAALALGVLGLIGNGCSSSSSSTTGGGDGSTPTDAGKGKETGTVGDTGTGGGDPACFDSTGFFALDPTKVAAPGLGQNVCAAGDITTIIADCFHSAADAGPAVDGPTQCDADLIAHGSCGECILGFSEFPDGGGQEGPNYPAALQISQDGNVVPNTFGCIAALSTGTATCKANFNALAECAVSTCSNCADADYSGCVDAELSDPTATCLQQFPDADSACLDAINTAASSTDATNKCASGQTDFNAALTTIATSLCGAP